MQERRDCLLNSLKFKLINTIGAGRSFGEKALLWNIWRTARIVCSTDCQFAVMTRKDFTEILGKKSFLSTASIEKDRMEKMKTFLSEIPLFYNWDQKIINNLYFKIETKQWIYKQQILKKDQESQFIYIIYEGEFEEFTVPKVTKAQIMEENSPQYQTLKKFGFSKERDRDRFVDYCWNLGTKIAFSRTVRKLGFGQTLNSETDGVARNNVHCMQFQS